MTMTEAPVRVCVVGCGAIGSLYAAHLAQLPGVEVWAYDRAREHVDAINRDGLHIVGAERLTARIAARTDAGEIPSCEFGIFATKGTATEAAITSTQRIFFDGAVCSVQNGIGNEEIIARYVPRVIRGVTLPAGRVVEPGVVHMDAPGPTWIGPYEPRPEVDPDVERLAALLTAGGMETRAHADVRGAQWTKLLFNASTNPLCALTGLTHGQLCDFAPTRTLAGMLIDEGERIAAALGIELDDDPRRLIDDAARTNHDHVPSMLQDVMAHRRTEIATLNGGIVDAASRIGLDAPSHAMIVKLIAGLEHGWATGANP